MLRRIENGAGKDGKLFRALTATRKENIANVFDVLSRIFTYEFLKESALTDSDMKRYECILGST